METSSENGLPVKIDLALKCILENKNIIPFKIDWRRLIVDANSYLSELYEIEVSGRTKGEEIELQLFVKNIVDGSSMKTISVPDAFVNELFAYKELFKIFAELQDLANIPFEKRYQTVKMYEESNEEIIIMENVTKKGFTANHSMNILTLNFFEMSVKELAKFHGLSFVLRETRPKYFNEKIKSIRRAIYFGEDWKQKMDVLRDVGMDNVGEKFKDKLEQVYENLKYKYVQYWSDESLRVCFCHGDYKFLNIMNITNDGEKRTVIPIDYQFIHYGCPVFDFLFLIFTGTDRNFRKANLLNLKELYYETLKEFLRYFNLDVDTVYPKEDFEKVFKEKLDFGLMSAILCLPFMLVTGDDVPDITQLDLNFKYNKATEGLYHDVIEDFIEWGYL